jgi:hypothetical protein
MQLTMPSRDMVASQGYVRMELLFVIGQIACLAALAYGAWICLTCAGRYNAESAQADRAASGAAQNRGHAELRIVIEPLNSRDLRVENPAPSTISS